MKKITLLALVFILTGCISPKVTVEKNVTVTVTINGQRCSIEECGQFFPLWIDIEYTTKADLRTKLEVEQDIKPETTIPFQGF